MKKIFIILLLSAVFISCSSSRNDSNDWELIVYEYQTGTVPPPYYYEYTINIKDNGEGRLSYKPDYNSDTNTWGYNIKLTKSNLKELTRSVKISGIMKKKMISIPEERQPIGGSIEYVIVTYRDENNFKTVKSPLFPNSKEDSKNLNSLYTLIKTFIPKDIWDDIDVRKKNYIDENKDKE